MQIVHDNRIKLVNGSNQGQYIDVVELRQNTQKVVTMVSKTRRKGGDIEAWEGRTKAIRQRLDTYTDMAMDDQADPEQTIKDGIIRSAGYESSDSERDESCREESFKSPMV